MPDRDKSKDRLIAELVALRQRLKDAEDEGAGRPETPPLHGGRRVLPDHPGRGPGPDLARRQDARCDWFNATWLAFTGRELAQEVGDGWAENVHPDDFDRCLETYLGAFGARRFFEMEYRLRRRDAEYRWILDIGCPFKDAAGEFAGYIGYCFDVTERKRNEEFRAEVERIIRHNIKTPLAGLHGLAQVALADGIDDTMRKLIPPAAHGALRGRAGRFRGSLRRDGARAVHAPGRLGFDLGTVVDDVGRSLAGILERRRVAARRLARRGVDASQAVPCHAEELLVRDMVGNIVRNAVEASPEGGEVTVGISSAARASRILVHNQGAMPSSVRPRFAQRASRPASPAVPGSGPTAPG